ncbi:hypothetical protein BU24DRAFT_231934 [Aaosphaeria arxii CBS 175.79]|uniref:Uncharacterized protein n=1 Tax=Aaosphaeria arxii CBS 175.79 TaxID=1450172 RepID=A0A6A5XK58_9PLEO|nr:uncharacterized protein BU24DRAFT_231934 [Aaosphaeria arxii CBS 175.79]KAF2013197.1 hypothetical protein BU24DRAFT_231934 [Aaosphaeria arxii CBS 175.79]
MHPSIWHLAGQNHSITSQIIGCGAPRPVTTLYPHKPAARPGQTGQARRGLGAESGRSHPWGGRQQSKRESERAKFLTPSPSSQRGKIRYSTGMKVSSKRTTANHSRMEVRNTVFLFRSPIGWLSSSVNCHLFYYFHPFQQMDRVVVYYTQSEYFTLPLPTSRHVFRGHAPVALGVGTVQ